MHQLRWKLDSDQKQILELGPCTMGGVLQVHLDVQGPGFDPQSHENKTGFWFWCF